jgi:hypothetical protein
MANGGGAYPEYRYDGGLGIEGKIAHPDVRFDAIPAIRPST